jgi:capsular polysaccharide biosynthesis protein
LELRQYFATLRRRWIIVVLTILAGASVAWWNTPRESRYATVATIYVGARQFGLSPNSVNGGVDQVDLVGRLLATYAKMIGSEPIAQDAVKTTNVQRSPGGVVGATTVGVDPGTQLIRIRVIDPEPRVAQALANGLANAFVEKVQVLEGTAPAGEGTVPSLPAYVFESAKLPVFPIPIGATRNLTLGAIFGFLAAAAAAFLLEYLDLTIKSPSEAEHRLELPVLGVIPMSRDLGPSTLRIVTSDDRDSEPASRAVRGVFEQRA